MKITRTITKANYKVLVYNRDSEQLEKRDFVDTDNIKPEFLEKSIMRSLDKNQRLADFKQIERLSFKLTMEMKWDGDMPTVEVVSIEPIETEAYAE